MSLWSEFWRMNMNLLEFEHTVEYLKIGGEAREMIRGYEHLLFFVRPRVSSQHSH